MRRIVFNLRKHKNLVVILEKGGQNCHLMINAREKGSLTVLHRPNALSLLKSGSVVDIYKNGDIRI